MALSWESGGTFVGGRSGLGQEVRALVAAVDLAAPDDTLAADWRAAIDGLRILFHASPTGTRRERELLLSVARNAPLVRALRAAVAAADRVDPTWLAVFAAEGSPESAALVERQRPRLASDDRLLRALDSFRGALEAPPPPAPRATAPTSPRTLTAAEFWAIVDEAAATGDAAAGLRERLEELTLSQLAAFDRHFEDARDAAYRWDLWGAAHLLQGGCSDDGFADFRSELVARGRAVFERVLRDPDALADDLSDLGGDEAIASLAAEIYEERAGKPLPARRRAPPRSPAGERFDFDDAAELRRRYPRLFAASARAESKPDEGPNKVVHRTASPKKQPSWS